MPNAFIIEKQGIRHWVKRRSKRRIEAFKQGINKPRSEARNREDRRNRRVKNECLARLNPSIKALSNTGNQGIRSAPDAL